MVLLDVVRFEVQAFLLEGLLLDAADEALTLFIVEHLFPLDSEGGKFIDEDTSEDVLEEHTHDDNVDHVVGEPAGFEGIHVLADLLLDVEFNHAVEDSLAVVVGVLVGVYGLDVVVHGENREERVERYTEEGQNTQHLQADLQGGYDVLEYV